MTTTVPIIEMSSWTEGDREVRRQIATAVDDAATTASSPCCGPIPCQASRSCDPTAVGCRCFLYPVLPVPGALLINLGDLLARWSNDRWLSTMHRVVPPRDTAGQLVRRRSAAYFHDGNADAIIATLEPGLAADGTSSYDVVTVGEHLAQKLGGSRGLELNPHAEREASRVTAAAPHPSHTAT